MKALSPNKSVSLKLVKDGTNTIETLKLGAVYDRVKKATNEGFRCFISYNNNTRYVSITAGI